MLLACVSREHARSSRDSRFPSAMRMCSSIAALAFLQIAHGQVAFPPSAVTGISAEVLTGLFVGGILGFICCCCVGLCIARTEAGLRAGDQTRGVRVGKLLYLPVFFSFWCCLMPAAAMVPLTLIVLGNRSGSKDSVVSTHLEQPLATHFYDHSS